MRRMIIGALAASLALGACSNKTPATDEKAPQAGAVEEGVSGDALEIEEVPVEEGAPAADASDTATPAADTDKATPETK